MGNIAYRQELQLRVIELGRNRHVRVLCDEHAFRTRDVHRLWHSEPRNRFSILESRAHSSTLATEGAITPHMRHAYALVSSK